MFASPKFTIDFESIHDFVVHGSTFKNKYVAIINSFKRHLKGNINKILQLSDTLNPNRHEHYKANPLLAQIF